MTKHETNVTNKETTMPKRKVTTVVTIEVKLVVPYKKTPGWVLQCVSNNLGTSVELDKDYPQMTSIQLIKKETTYA
jgi:hypothetical protein